MKKPLLVLITGASGCGKTTITKALEQQLPSTETSVYYFDDIGIPSMDEMIDHYGSSEQWQEWATRLWIEKLAKITDKKLIVLEGSFNPEFAVTKIHELGIMNYLIICLYVEQGIREQRLLEDRVQAELVTQEMENFAQMLRVRTESIGGINIDCSRKTVSKIVDELRHLILLS